MSDIIARLAPGQAVAALRARRPVTRDHGQASHDALLAAADTAEVTLAERLAVAAYIAALHSDAPGSAEYGARLRGVAPRLADAVAEVAAATVAEGPYGRYPAGPLSAEDREGPGFALPTALAETLGPRLCAAFAHAHLLVLHPRDASVEAIAALRAAGWSPDAIVTLSQLVAFLAYQIRAAHGLRVLATA
ncbi:CMD domain protein [Falsiroseomonas sp. HW251]|uniref:CMD domain protein n=1 Tax=Falsiroseomonas sp. HW251 TaxID=3390998 RepID=UPI003D311905